MTTTNVTVTQNALLASKDLAPQYWDQFERRPK